MIRLDEVTFIHQDDRMPALDRVSLRVHPGEVVVVTGASGSGKTTLTRVVNGLIPHLQSGSLSGEIEVAGLRPERSALHRTAAVVGSVFQNPRTQFFATEVLSELAFGAENAGLAPQCIAAAVADALERFGIGGLAGRNVFTLSGGQKQVLACASVDVLRPPVLVLDEPTANLDADGTRRIAEAIAAWKSEGRAVLVAEHRVGWVLDVADRVLVMAAGRIVAAFTPAQFRALTPEERQRWGLRDPNAGFVGDLRAESSTADCGPIGGLSISDVEARHRGTVLRFARGEFPTGEIVALTGANGAGKSTFARFLVGLHGRGRVEREGRALPARRRRATSALVMQDVGHQLFADTVRAEVELAQRTGDGERTDSLLHALDLSGLAERHPLALSAGEQQRLAVAAALAGERRVVVLDEPTSGLDRARMESVAALLRDLRERGTDVYVITHDRELIERAATWRVHLDREGGTARWRGAAVVGGSDPDRAERD